jgi:hypothetical protein
MNFENFMKQDILTEQMPTQLWYQYYQIIKEDAPELVDEFIEDTAARLELTCDYFIQEFL